MDYKFKKENIKSLKDVAYDAIKEAILSNDLKAGEKLTEATISSQLGISRGPIREALRQLERDGLVKSQPYKGTIVAEFNMDEVDNVYIPMRQTIEFYACCRASKIFQPDDFSTLEHLVTEMDAGCSEKNIEKISRTDSAFHRYIVFRCTSAMLVSIWDSMAAHFYGRIFFQNRVKREKPEFSKIPQEHRELITAIQSGNPDLIRSCVNCHIQ